MSHTVPVVFHRGHAADYEQKAETYRQKTGFNRLNFFVNSFEGQIL